jgi:hypothetical protein
MIKDKNIICISNTTWYGKYAKSTVQILSRLAKHNKVLFVEYPYTIKDVFYLIGKENKIISRIFGFNKRILTYNTDVNSKVYDFIVPPAIPSFFIKNEKVFNFIFKLNISMYEFYLRKTIKKLQIKNPIVITAFNPFYGLPMQGKLKEIVNVYYCYDGVESGYFGKRIFDYEDKYSKNADLIITTSEYLNSQKLKINTNSFVVKNGVDFTTFNKYAKSQPNLNSKKTVGYIGSLDSRFDIDTIEFVIQNLDNFIFEFTGDLRNEQIKKRLSKYKNVSFFESVKPNEVAKLIAKYDVGIIPYIVNEVNKNIYPLKINEYLSVGVPVVMTNFALLSEFDEIISVSLNKEDFLKHLLNEVNMDSENKIKQRIEFAKQNSWDSRTELFSDIIEKFL